MFTLGTQPGGEGGSPRHRDVVPRGMAAGAGGREGLPGPHEPPAAWTKPCRQPGRRRRRLSLPPVPAALPRVAAAAPPLPPLRRRLRAPPPPRVPPAIAPGWGGGAGLGTCSLRVPKKERRARKMQTHRWKDEGDCRFRVFKKKLNNKMVVVVIIKAV